MECESRLDNPSYFDTPSNRGRSLGFRRTMPERKAERCDANDRHTKTLSYAAARASFRHRHVIADLAQAEV